MASSKGSSRWRWVAIAKLTFVMGLALACTEELTTPVKCPPNCPGSGIVVIDTVLDLVPGGDTSFSGYVGNGDGSGILVSNNLPWADFRALIRFPPRPDSVAINVDTFATYTIDSVSLLISLQARDSTVGGLRLFMYRMPVSLDSTASFNDVESELIPANLIDSILIPDSARTQDFTVMFKGTDLAKIEPAPGDSGRISIGLRVAAGSRQTGIRIGSRSSPTDAPTWTTFVKANFPDSTRIRRTMLFTAEISVTVMANPPSPTPDQLLVGSLPSSRALLRFQLPEYIRDSAQILRATLEMVPVGPIYGLNGDPATLQLMQILSDQGAKSPNQALSAAVFPLPNSYSDTVRFEIPQLIGLWKTTKTAPLAVFLRIIPEGASFSIPIFYGTRSPSGQPHLRITYAKSFDFQRP
ncbi:MAG TPA: hypothetical protein VLT17_00150 [Gemmatimonadales bacterium]|jgi:hypothetical protein|nr:hypothetical protein [Gemmatimonadales bacterium]